MAPNNDYSKSDLDNHSNQLNPNNDAYWESRGFEEHQKIGTKDSSLMIKVSIDK